MTGFAESLIATTGLVRDVFVQRGAQNLSGTTVDVTIESINLDHTFPLISLKSNATGANAALVKAELIDSETLRLSRQDSTNSVDVEWQVIQNLNWEVQKVTGSTASNSFTGAINAVDPTECFIAVSGDTTETGTTTRSTAFANFVDTTTVEVFRNTTTSNFSAVAYVVSIPGAFVQRNQLVNMSSLSIVETITAVDLSRSFLFVKSQTVLNAAQTSLVRGSLTATTSATFERISTSGTAIFSYQVVELPEANVQQITIATDGSNSAIRTIDSVDLTRSFVTISNRGNDTTLGDQFLHQVNAQIVSPTEVQVQRSVSTNSTGYVFFAIEV